MPTLPRPWAYLWAAPTTVLGLAGLILTASRTRLVHGVLEGHGSRVAILFDLVSPMRRTAAMTLGHVVLGRDACSLERTREHERVHVAQCERWGPFFIPAYLVASALARARGGDAYLDNAFERQARRQTGPGPGA